MSARPIPPIKVLPSSGTIVIPTRNGVSDPTSPAVDPEIA